VFKLLKSIFKSAFYEAENDPELKKFEGTHPKLIRFLKGRFDPRAKYGLSLTIGLIITFFFVYLFFGILQDVIGRDPIYFADIRVLNLVALYRTTRLNHVMLFFTTLGKGIVIAIGVFLLANIYIFKNKPNYLITLLVSVIAGQLIFVELIKRLVHRTRPEFANVLVFENSFSFPSGHTFVAVSFYGLLTFFLFRIIKNRLLKIITVISGILLILTIGFSRIYLGAHFPTDVLASLAAGGAWLTAVITAFNIWEKSGEKKKRRPLDFHEYIGLIAVLFFMIWLGSVIYYYKHTPLLTPKPLQTTQLSQSQIPQKIFENYPKTSETITGKPMEPINIIVIGSKNELDDVFSSAGWSQTDPINLNSTIKIGVDTVLNKPDPKAPGTPSFWDQKPNEFAYEKATGNSPRQRQHIHFWSTPYIYNQKPIWVATAHFDKSVVFNGIVPTHQIDPDVDNERERVKTELTATGSVSGDSDYQLVPKELGKNAVGSLFFTDGKTAIIYLK
jgi:undecaprenyl-diphosphatase